VPSTSSNYPFNNRFNFGLQKPSLKTAFGTPSYGTAGFGQQQSSLFNGFNLTSFDKSQTGNNKQPAL
jgi:hypothetical protein